MRDQKTIEFSVLGQTRIGALPSIQVRHHIHGAELLALGYTADDLERGMDASGKRDMLSLRCVYFAAVGACWGGAPEGWASLRDHRNDVVAFGDDVFEALYRANRAPTKLAAELQVEGRRLLREMIGDLAALTAEVKTEAGFTEPASAGSRSSTG